MNQRHFSALQCGLGWLVARAMLCGVAGVMCSLATGQSAMTAAHSGPWQMQDSTTRAGLRGIHAVGGGVAWASGTDGTVLRTEDGGYMWQSCGMPPGAEKLDFRGVWAWDADTAVVMSSGPGDLSRLYKTTDGCSHWKLIFTNPDKDGFWDAVVFWDKDKGEIAGDPVQVPVEDWSHFITSDKDPPPEAPTGPPTMETQFATFSTWDAGKTWQRSMNSFLKSDPKRSGAFAASNSSLFREPGWGWFGIGGLDGSFVFRGQNATDLPLSDGLMWQKVAVPLASGTEASGIFSLAFRDAQHGMAVGGDYKKPNESAGTAAWTGDGGRTWTAATHPPHGYRSAVAWDEADKAWIAAGTNGSDISYDDGKTWEPLDDGNWNALSLPYVVGPGGRMARLNAALLKAHGTASKESK